MLLAGFVTALVGVLFSGIVHSNHEFLNVKGYGEGPRRISFLLAGFLITENPALISILRLGMGAVYAYIGKQALSEALHDLYYRSAVKAIDL